MSFQNIQNLIAVGSCKIKISYILLYYKRKTTRTTRPNQNKAKLKSSKVKLSVKHLGLTHNLLSSKGILQLSSGSAIHTTHSLSCKLKVAPLCTCFCTWWSSHSIGISKMLKSPMNLGLYLHLWLLLPSSWTQTLTHGATPQPLSTPSFLGFH